ncbi:HAF repeat-containing protein [Delftia tsuruhatensis]|uniref:HAF repeat-containing protein n=1 Tax=Delftia tsuruhatensis TaxID=180282 RepID=UPI001F23C05F|nr:HAF repeat-containing protein [Delftia tsuruhatensis]
MNTSGHVVGACAKPDGSAVGFVALTPGTAVELGRLATARSCAATIITNGGRILGSCLNNDSLTTAVVWNANSPTTVQPLQPLLGGVRTMGTAYNHGGATAGVSVSANNTAQPVMWRINETTARSLPAGLLGLDATNCVPTDIDSTAPNPNMPNISGNCPGTNGRPQPVLWAAGLLGAYGVTTLPLPTGALYCTTTHVANGRILGNCDFGAQGGRAVLWPNASTTPLVLVTNPARNSASDLNSSGGVIGRYQNANGDSIPFYWDTTTNTRTDIPPLSGGFKISVADLGDNGLVSGTSETGDGTRHAIRWTLSGGTVDLGTLPGGKNSSGRGLSQDGCYLTGGSEVALDRDTHAFLQNLCTP